LGSGPPQRYAVWSVGSQHERRPVLAVLVLEELCWEVPVLTVLGPGGTEVMPAIADSLVHAEELFTDTRNIACAPAPRAAPRPAPGCESSCPRGSSWASSRPVSRQSRGSRPGRWRACVVSEAAEGPATHAPAPLCALRRKPRRLALSATSSCRLHSDVQGHPLLAVQSPSRGAETCPPPLELEALHRPTLRVAPAPEFPGPRATALRQRISEQ